jgi:signal transduction histidine kinase
VQSATGTPAAVLPPSSVWRSYGWRDLATALAVAAAYYGGAKVGLALTFSPHPISVLWPPNSILLAALLLTSARQWWLILAVLFPVHLFAELGANVPAAMVLCWYASNVAEALIGAASMRLLFKTAPTFEHMRDVGLFALCCGFAGPFFSSFLDAGFVLLVGWSDGSYWELWRTRFVSNVAATLAIVPFVLAWVHTGFKDMRRAPVVRHLEGGVMMGGLLVVGALAFDAAPGVVPPALLLYLPLPFLLWAALRFGPAGASATMLLLALLAIWGGSHGRGPFVGADPHVSVLAIQVFLIFVGVTLLVLTAALEERRFAARALRGNEERLAHVSRLAVVGELTASIAHEINQPLGAILSNADAAEILLGREQVPVEELRQVIEDIRKDAMRAGEVIRHMRALLRRRELTMQPFDLNRAIGDVLGLTGADLGRHRVAVETSFGPIPTIIGDQVHLQQVMLNLILNGVDAVSALPAGKRRLSIATARRDAGIEVAISDSGPGIAAEDAAHLFDSFFTTKPHGLGLGLSIARSIVEAHGGSIRAETQAGGGASFIFFLPGQSGGSRQRPGSMFGGRQK